MGLAPSQLFRGEATNRGAFDEALSARGLPELTRHSPTTLQLNLTTRCNLACHHCHVESGPNRTEALDRVGCERILELLAGSPRVDLLDITGGAPELHPEFRSLVRGARALGKRVIDRCNLTILLEDGQEGTAEFLAEQGVDIVASLPCYTLENVDQQRGRGVFDGSIDVLRQLNQLGYGMRSAGGRRLVLDLIYNPGGAYLPPPQHELETTYRAQLRERFGIEFDALLTITNMPIKRFAHDLIRDGRMEEYMALLLESFNPRTVDGVMCRSLVSVDHRGHVYDCDFNQALALDPSGGPLTIWDIEDLAELEGRRIATAAHCFGCTAGSGSSCGGSLTMPGSTAERGSGGSR